MNNIKTRLNYNKEMQYSYNDISAWQQEEVVTTVNDCNYWDWLSFQVAISPLASSCNGQPGKNELNKGENEVYSGIRYFSYFQVGSKIWRRGSSKEH